MGGVLTRTKKKGGGKMTQIKDWLTSNSINIDVQKKGEWGLPKCGIFAMQTDLFLRKWVCFFCFFVFSFFFDFRVFFVFEFSVVFKFAFFCRCFFAFWNRSVCIAQIPLSSVLESNPRGVHSGRTFGVWKNGLMKWERMR